MGEVIQLTKVKQVRKLDARNILANLANSSEGELALKLAELVEQMDKNNHVITRLYNV